MNKKKSPLERFQEKCAFDPITGCVIWTGGQTSGKGHNVPYGAFWFEGRRWFAHRWAAKYIHGLDIDGSQVDHCCPCGPHTLCMEHLQCVSADVNRELQHSRPGRCYQSPEIKQFWLFIHKGIERLPETERIEGNMPFYNPPEWIAV